MRPTSPFKSIVLFNLALFVSFWSSIPALAQDWGYDRMSGNDTNNSVNEMQASPQSLNFEDPSKSKNAYSSSSVGIADSDSAEVAWLQIFAICQPLADKSKLPQGPDFQAVLTKAQKARFLAYLKEKVKTDPEGFGAIKRYWGELKVAFRTPDHLDNYRLLFRSLLRMKAEDTKTPQKEKEVLQEVLGPAMIAIEKDPGLSEEAIEAYSDMACFLYTQTHPGKTVDAEDNRKLFALVIKDKFNKAPAYADRLAMSYFPVNWAKFRILYTDANDVDRRILVEKLARKGSSGGPVVRNSLLEKVLSSNPWKSTLVAAKKRTKLVGLEAKVKALPLGDMNK